MSSRLFMLIAGEASGDLLAAELVSALKESPQVQAMAFPPVFFGAGGPRMAEAGVELALDLTRHSVIGMSDAAGKGFVFLRRLLRLRRLAIQKQPDVIVLVDFSVFNHLFARVLRRYLIRHRGIFNNWSPKIVKYVSPQVWASRPGRAYRMPSDFDLLLTIFPFEKEWYAARVPELSVEFVGHPLLERFQRAKALHRDPEVFANPPLILLLPGSRSAEVRRHLPLLLEAAEKIRDVKPDARFKIVWPSEELKRIGDQTCSCPTYLEIQIRGLDEALAGATLAVAKSGTVALECALFGVPAVVFYKASWPSYALARMLVSISHLAMPNLLAKEEVFPEFVQHAATSANIAGAALELLTDPVRQKAIKAKLAEVIKALGGPGASGRAACAVLRLLEEDSRLPRAALAD